MAGTAGGLVAFGHHAPGSRCRAMHRGSGSLRRMAAHAQSLCLVTCGCPLS